MDDTDNNIFTSQSIAGEILDVLIDNVMRIHVSQQNKQDILNFTVDCIDCYLSNFDLVLKTNVESKQIYYDEFEPSIGVKDNVARRSVKLIAPERQIDIYNHTLKIEPKIVLSLAFKDRPKINRSFNIRSSTRKSSSKEQNKSISLSRVRVETSLLEKSKTVIRKIVPNINMSQLKSSIHRKRLPEVETKVLETETKHTAPEFKFFYTRKESKEKCVSAVSKDFEFKPFISEFAGICSLDGQMISNETGASDSRTLTDKPKFFVKSRFITKTTNKGNVGNEELASNGQPRNTSKIQVYDISKLKRLLS